MWPEMPLVCLVHAAVLLECLLVSHQFATLMLELSLDFPKPPSYVMLELFMNSC